MDNSTELYDKNFSFWNLNSVVNFYKDKHLQIFLFIIVFVIIYVVDYISNFNSMIFAMPSVIPGVPSQTPQKQGKPVKPSKRGKSSKK